MAEKNEKVFSKEEANQMKKIVKKFGLEILSFIGIFFGMSLFTAALKTGEIQYIILGLSLSISCFIILLLKIRKKISEKGGDKVEEKQNNRSEGIGK